MESLSEHEVQPFMTGLENSQPKIEADVVNVINCIWESNKEKEEIPFDFEDICTKVAGIR